MVEADVLSKVFDCGLKSNHMEVDRLVGAVLRELYGCRYDLKIENRICELAMEKIEYYKQKDDIAALEVQRNFVMVLNKMLHSLRTRDCTSENAPSKSLAIKPPKKK